MIRPLKNVDDIIYSVQFKKTMNVEQTTFGLLYQIISPLPEIY